MMGFENIHQQEGSMEKAAEGVNSREKELSNADSEVEFGTVDRGLAMQHSVLVDIPEEGKRGGVDEITEHMVGDWKNSISFDGRHLEMCEKSGSLVSGKSTCKMNVDAETCAIESDSLQTTEENRCYEAHRNSMFLKGTLLCIKSLLKRFRH
jgi:hypothetical protein